MPFQVPKSQVGPDFKKAVAAHLNDIEGWRKHMENVARDPTTYQAYPMPVASHPLVAQSIRKDADANGRVTFTADYQIVEDGPTPGQTLRAKKNHLLGVVSQMEQEAQSGLLAPGKRRHLTYMATDAKAKKPEARTADDLKAIERHAALIDMMTKIDRHGARLHDEIEDLDATNVDAWKPAEFPK